MSKWKIASLIVLGLVLCILGWALYLYSVAGEFKTIEPHFEGSCQVVEGLVGAEDITFRPDGSVAYISADDRRSAMAGAPTPGALYSYVPGSGKALVNLLPKAEQNFHPHGLGLYIAEGQPDRLFVVNHPKFALSPDQEDTQPHHTIEIFDIIDNKAVHVKTISGEALVSPNDVLPVGPDRFYVTNDHGGDSMFTHMFEDYLRLSRANVVYFNGALFTVVAEELLYANGINMSTGGEEVYVTSTTDRILTSYDRNSETGALKKKGEIFLETGVDNIEIDSSGNLWIGSHPKLLTFVAHSKNSSKKSPSQVLKLTPKKDGGFEVTEVFLSDGKDLSGSSVAARYKESLLIGSVYENKILDCRLK